MVSSGATLKHFQEVIKLSGHVQYDSTATTPENGGIYMYIVSSQTPATNEVNFNFTSRLSYTDN